MKVSIVMPTYNCARYVLTAINSALSQTLQDFELLVVDDCSTDGTVEKVRTINDDRIRLFVNKKNMGAAYCRNVALKHASGEYIAFLDGDDFWFPEKLEKQVTFMENNNYYFSYTNYEEFDKDGERLNIVLTGPSKISHKSFMKVCYVGCLTVMYKKELMPDLEIPNDIYKRNDYALWLKISEKADCYLLNEILSCYRKNCGISSNSKTKLLKYHKDMFCKLYNYNPAYAWILAFRNAFYYFLKRIKYRRKK